MSPWSLLLRLLLALALVFNGAAPAMAAIHAGHIVAPHQATETGPVAESETPCHEHREAGNANRSSAPDGQPASPDCCESGACRCACVHSTTLAIIEFDIVAPVVGHTESVRPMALGHPDAALPHLIRPPIG